MGRAYLVGGHRERVNVALFRGVAVREAELWRVKQFWSHVADNSWFRRCGTTRLHDCGVGYDACDPEVTQTCRTITSDQDVSLDRTNISARLELGTRSGLTGLISLWTILSECRYSSPQAVCASYRNKFQEIFSMKIIGVAYQLKSIDPLILLGVLNNVPV